MNLLFIKQPGIIKMDRKGTALIIMLLGLLTVSMTERCDPCPPGKYMETVCLEGFPNDRICVSCAPGTFLSRPNLAEGCFVHKVCDKPNMVTTFRGNTTHDAVCGCEVSYHLERGSCERNVYCEKGEGIVDNGIRCEPCTNGTYSDKLSDVEPCLPWTNCSKYGMDIAEEGTASSDRVCYGQSTEEPTSATPFVTVTILTGTTAVMPEIKVIIQPTTNTLIVVVLPVVSIALGFLACVGIYFLVTLKGCKIFWKKRLQHYHVESPGSTAEEAILVQGGSNPVTVEDLGMHSSVECEEDSISTNPKEKEASLSSHNQEDSQRLLHFVDSQITLPTPLPAQLTNFTVMNNPAYVSYADEQDGHENEEPIAEESSHREQSSPREIPPASPEEPLVSPSTLASSRETSASSLAYREEGVDLVLDVYSKELVNRQMELLAAEIGQDWPYLAERLGLDRSQVDHTLNDYKGDMQEQVYVMLNNWRQGKTGNATISDLHDALIECNRGELCRRLLSLSEAHSLTSPGPHAPPGADAVT